MVTTDSPSIRHSRTLKSANMRLVDTATVQVVEINGLELPAYAILSHTWVAGQEVSLQEMQALSRSRWSPRDAHASIAIRAKTGYAKIKRCAEYVASHGFRYVWIDTCCIDKTSSAELSEAINSMFRWYKEATICFAYLSDVTKKHEGDSADDFYNTYRESRWFQRGWTLQELIAPEDIVFCDAEWVHLGSKEHDRHIQRALALITGIDIRILDGSLEPAEVSIADRMKWAAGRQTTRPEDTAYCLMGIFDVKMPLMYGEGNRAFLRLQEEILSASDDQSIFIWSESITKTETVPNKMQLHGLLADSPEVFANIREHYRPLPPAVDRMTTAWSVTNQGLKLRVLLRSIALGGNLNHDDYHAILECTTRRTDETYWSPAISLRRLHGDQFARVDSNIITTMPTPEFDRDTENQLDSWETIFVKREPQYAFADILVSYKNVLRYEADDSMKYLMLEDVWPQRQWDAEAATLKIKRSTDSQLAGLFRFQIPGQALYTIDVAVHLQNQLGRACAIHPWFRRSHGTVRQAVSSALRQLLPPPGVVDRRQEERGSLFSEKWSPHSDGLQVNITLKQRKLHGRLYYYVQAETMRPIIEHSRPCLGDAPVANIPADKAYEAPSTRIPDNFGTSASWAHNVSTSLATVGIATAGGTLTGSNHGLIAATEYNSEVMRVETREMGTTFSQSFGLGAFTAVTSKAND
ncbi:HET domain-containing protein [Microdochium nivale]|nr:HET domain-containing protein [Microdochium nivale]